MPRASDPNHATAADIEPLGRGQRRPPSTPTQGGGSSGAAAAAARGPRRSPRIEKQESRLHEYESKRAIFAAYAGWVRTGSKRADSPIAELVEKYGCDRSYPKKLYDRCLGSGTVENNWAGGRPTEFDDEFWEKTMVPLIRKARSEQKSVSSRKVTATIKKKKKGKGPSHVSVAKAKKDLGFKKHKVQKKPKLSTALWAQRFAMAKARKGASDAAYIKAHARTVMGDEKWSRTSPVPDLTPSSTRRAVPPLARGRQPHGGAPPASLPPREARRLRSLTEPGRL